MVTYYVVRPGPRYIHKEFLSVKKAMAFAQEYVEPPWGIRMMPSRKFNAPPIHPFAKAVYVQHGPAV